jgi:hydrogenase-4 component E
MHGLPVDVAHMLSGGRVLVSLMLLYQVRKYSLLSFFALHAAILGTSVAGQACIHNAPRLGRFHRSRR